MIRLTPYLEASTSFDSDSCRNRMESPYGHARTSVTRAPKHPHIILLGVVILTPSRQPFSGGLPLRAPPLESSESAHLVSASVVATGRSAAQFLPVLPSAVGTARDGRGVTPLPLRGDAVPALVTADSASLGRHPSPPTPVACGSRLSAGSAPAGACAAGLACPTPNSPPATWGASGGAHPPRPPPPRAAGRSHGLSFGTSRSALWLPFCCS